jgi:signal transduction histidine kinase
VEAGRLEVISEPFAPVELVERLRSRMSVLADDKALSLNVVIDPALPEILLGDAGRLGQIATNLLSNAIKFTHDGSVTLEVRQHSPDTWQIIVSDTGIGIPEEAQQYIFEAFRQVDSSSQRRYGGSGLGLAIVQQLCRLMNGSIEVVSRPGAGSTFTITLPLVEATEFEY